MNLINKSINFLIALILPMNYSFAFNPESINNAVLNSCERNNGVNIELIQYSLKEYENIQNLIKQKKISEDQGTEIWRRFTIEIENALNTMAEQNREASIRHSTDAQIFSDLRTTAFQTATVSTIIKYVRKNYTLYEITNHFVEICKQTSNKISKSSIDDYRARRVETDRQLQKIDRDIDRIFAERENQSKEKILNIGAGIFGKSSTPSSPSGPCFFTKELTVGLHKTCYYNCPTGVITSTIGPAEMCTPTR